MLVRCFAELIKESSFRDIFDYASHEGAAIGSHDSWQKHEKRFVNLRARGFLLQAQKSQEIRDRHEDADQQGPSPRPERSHRSQENARGEGKQRGEQQISNLHFDPSGESAQRGSQEIEELVRPWLGGNASTCRSLDHFSFLATQRQPSLQAAGMGGISGHPIHHAKLA